MGWRGNPIFPPLRVGRGKGNGLVPSGKTARLAEAAPSLHLPVLNLADTQLQAWPSPWSPLYPRPQLPHPRLKRRPAPRTSTAGKQMGLEKWRSSSQGCTGTPKTPRASTGLGGVALADSCHRPHWGTGRLIHNIPLSQAPFRRHQGHIHRNLGDFLVSHLHCTPSLL